jgi:DNA-binding NarL/FixJ family response regulator
MRTDGKVRIVIAEDHELFRKGLRLILQKDESMETVGEAATVLHAIRVINRLKPDVALLNTTLPETGGIEVIPSIRQESPMTKAIMLAATMNETTIFKALKAGAKGYLSRDASVSNLIKAIKAVHQGDVWVERKMIARFFEGEATLHLQREKRRGMTNQELTPREQEILLCLTHGLTNKEIGQALFISEKTVKSHLNSIFKKLNVTRRLQAILYAIRQGLK